MKVLEIRGSSKTFGKCIGGIGYITLTLLWLALEKKTCFMFLGWSCTFQSTRTSF